VNVVALAERRIFAEREERDLCLAREHEHTAQHQLRVGLDAIHANEVALKGRHGLAVVADGPKDGFLRAPAGFDLSDERLGVVAGVEEIRAIAAREREADAGGERTVEADLRAQPCAVVANNGPPRHLGRAELVGAANEVVTRDRAIPEQRRLREELPARVGANGVRVAAIVAERVVLEVIDAELITKPRLEHAPRRAELRAGAEREGIAGVIGVVVLGDPVDIRIPVVRVRVRIDAGGR
jgi:hypothetical protein